MALIRNLTSSPFTSNQISLNWDQPSGFGSSDDEIIVTRTITHFPMELYNTSFPNKATDSRPIEIFRGRVITGLDAGTVSVSMSTLTDTSAAFPTNPSLKGRLLRDQNSQVFKILSNTSTSITVETGTPAVGKYVVLADFPSEVRIQQNFELDIRTTANYNSISNLVENVGGILQIVNFDANELDNLIFRDGAGTRFIIKNNNNSTINFYENFNFRNENLVTFTYNTVTGVIQFDSAVDLSNVSAGDIFKDTSNNKYVILTVSDAMDFITIAVNKNVDTTAPTLSEHGAIVAPEVPVVGSGMAIFNSYTNSQLKPYIDTYKTEAEASSRTGSGLLDDTFYYYTGFIKKVGVNVAQADYATYDSASSTQTVALSLRNRQFGDLLYSLWPSLHRELDTTEDLYDLMQVFGFQMSEIHSLIETYKLQNTHTVFTNALEALADQTGLPSVSYAIGADTLRRISNDMISAWKLKGSKEGIALFIRIITTWDVTNGTGDSSGSIEDFLPNIEALRFFSASLGSLNTRITQTSPFVTGGRFARSLPGVVIPGFFSFREFVITIPNVALYIGESTAYTVSSDTTTMTDSAANFGTDDSLVGNFLLPNQEEVNDLFEIVANTATTITVKGTIINRTIGGNYAVLSPLNANRFIILNRLLPGYIPVKTRAGFIFT